MSNKTTGLGRGLSSLLGEDEAAKATIPGDRRPSRLPIEYLSANPFQPRHRFTEDQADELVQSIREKGVLQPILVRPTENPNSYQIIAGERRWRASLAAGLHNVPVIVRDLTDTEALQVALIENVQRQDLSPVEEARGYQRLIEEFSHTQNQLSKLVGKSRSHIANLIRLLVLPEAVIAMIDEGRLTMGHARTLIGADDPTALAHTIVSRGLNVRQAEDMAQGAKGKRSSKTTSVQPAKDADTRALERNISDAIGMRASLQVKGEGGTLSISYRTLEQLDDLCQRLFQH